MVLPEFFLKKICICQKFVVSLHSQSDNSGSPVSQFLFFPVFHPKISASLVRDKCAISARLVRYYLSRNLIMPNPAQRYNFFFIYASARVHYFEKSSILPLKKI